MSGNILPLNDRYGRGTNPIVESQRVVYNGTMNKKQYKKQKANKNPLYGGDKSDEIYNIYKGEICLAFANKPQMKSSLYVEDNAVISVLNGAFEKKDIVDGGISSLEDSMVFAGTCQNPIIPFDKSVNETSGMALHVGGYDTITNSGTENVEVGDRVLWRFPDPANTKITRKTFETAPYKPHLDRITEQSLRIMLKKKTTKSLTIKGPTIEAARNFEKVTKRNLVTALHTLMRAGIINPSSINVNTLKDNNQRLRNSQDYMRNTKAREEILTAIATEVGAIDGSNTTNSIFRDPVEKKTLEDMCIDTVLGEPNALPFALDGSGKDPVGIQGTINKITYDQLFTLFGFIQRANYQVERRVIGVAKSRAAPGMKFDCMIGTNHAI